MEPGVTFQRYKCLHLIDAYVQNIKEETWLDSWITYNAPTTVLIVTIIIIPQINTKRPNNILLSPVDRLKALGTEFTQKIGSVGHVHIQHHAQHPLSFEIRIIIVSHPQHHPKKIELQLISKIPETKQAVENGNYERCSLQSKFSDINNGRLCNLVRDTCWWLGATYGQSFPIGKQTLLHRCIMIGASIQILFHKHT